MIRLNHKDICGSRELKEATENKNNVTQITGRKKKVLCQSHLSLVQDFTRTQLSILLKEKVKM